MPIDFTKTKVERRIWSPGAKRFYQRQYVWATCPECGEGRWVRDSWAKHRARLDGVCRGCMNKYPEKYINNYKGHRSNKAGYTILHRKTFLPKQLAILESMFTIGYAHNYILEHRALMALHLRRPLKGHEIVHHLDGNKTNNDLSNLRLFTKATDHHPGHSSFYQEWQEALSEIGRLKEAIYDLKGSLLW